MFSLPSARLRLRTIGALVAILVLGSICAAEPAHAATDIAAQQFNTCGKICNIDQGQTMRPVDMVAFLEAVSNPKPVFITLNEVCQSQYAELVNNRGFNRLAGGRGYAYYFSITRTLGLPVACGGAFGNVLFVKGTPQGAPLDVPYVDQDLSGTYPETRRVLCERVNVFLILTACVTHTDPDGSHPANQSQEAYNLVQTTYAGQRRFLGGDLNTTSPPSWPSSYWDIDLLFGMRPTHSIENGQSPTRKIDYSWGDTAHQASVPSGSVACNMWPTSDHCHLSGKFQVT